MTGALRGGEVALVFSAVRLAAPSVLAGPFLCQLVAAAKSWRRLSAARFVATYCRCGPWGRPDGRLSRQGSRRPYVRLSKGWFREAAAVSSGVAV